jgi:hypothetical protein
MTKLFAARFENDDTSAALLEQFDAPENIGIRWNVESFGIERIEVTIKATSVFDIYERMNNHLGQRLAVYPSTLYRPVSGWITEVRPEGANRLTYIAKGPRWRFEDTFFRDVANDSDDTDDAVETILTDYVDIDNGDFSDIDATGTDADGAQPDFPEGNFPSEMIDRYCKMSDSSGNVWDFWMVDEPFSGVSLQQYKPYFKSRGGYTAADWIVSRADLTRLNLSRSIAEYRDQTLVYYGTFDGSCTTTQTDGIRLIDSTGNFTGFGVEPGDRVVNTTDGSNGKVESVINSTTLDLIPSGGNGLQGGTDNLWQSGDSYRITRIDSWYGEYDTLTISDPIVNRLYITREQYMNATQASQYADALLSFFSEPQQTQSFVIGSRWIKDSSGARRPPWSPIFEGGGVLRVSDLYPAAALFSETQNTLTSFLITAMDWDNRSHKLTVHVDTKDGRLDARLKRQGILGGEMVARH